MVLQSRPVLLPNEYQASFQSPEYLGFRHEYLSGSPAAKKLRIGPQSDLWAIRAARGPGPLFVELRPDLQTVDRFDRQVRLPEETLLGKPVSGWTLVIHVALGYRGV